MLGIYLPALLVETLLAVRMIWPTKPSEVRMADPVLHIKDSYFFEVPKFLWPLRMTKLVRSPASFLREAHPDATLDEFNHGSGRQDSSSRSRSER